MCLKLRVLFLMWFLFIIATLVNQSVQQNQDNEVNFHESQTKKCNCNTSYVSCVEDFPSEEHTVTTSDGYILSIFRMPKSKACQDLEKHRPVLLMHGLLSNSHSWLDTYPEPGLPYLLSDACYDLWLGNVRGNAYGRRHVRLNPDTDSEFWKFYSEEMGTYDLPAIIDYILKYTSSLKLNYIAHSQGCRLFYILCSEQPLYCNKIGVSISLAPAVRLRYLRSIPVQIFAKTYAFLEHILSKPDELEVLQQGFFIQRIAAFICHDYFIADTVCRGILAITDSHNPGSISATTLQRLYNNFPAGTSARNLATYGQNIITGEYRKYDFGVTKNLEIYGTLRPPLYDLSKTTVPVVIIYGNNDFLVDKKDIHWLLDQLPNLQDGYLVEDLEWNHFDFVYSMNINKYVFPKINEYLKKFSADIAVS